MTPETERRMRSLAANIVDLELRVKLLREANIAGKSHEELQQMRGDLYVAEEALREAEHERIMLRYYPLGEQK